MPRIPLNIAHAQFFTFNVIAARQASRAMRLYKCSAGRATRPFQKRTAHNHHSQSRDLTSNSRSSNIRGYSGANASNLPEHLQVGTQSTCIIEREGTPNLCRAYVTPPTLSARSAEGPPVSISEREVEEEVITAVREREITRTS